MIINALSIVRLRVQWLSVSCRPIFDKRSLRSVAFRAFQLSFDRGYLPVMRDHILMTEGSGLCRSGAVQAAYRQKTSGGRTRRRETHAQISGTVDFREPDDDACLKGIRALVDKSAGARALRSITSPRARCAPRREIYGIFSSSPKTIRHARIIARIVDGVSSRNIAPTWADRSLRLCAHRRLGRRHRGQPEKTRYGLRSGHRRKAHGIWARDSHRSRGTKRRASFSTA